MSDAEAAHGAYVAGLSRRVPADDYGEDGLSFGGARLLRHPHAPWEWAEVVLTLSASAAAACEAAGGSGAREVRIGPHREAMYLGRRSWDADRAPEGMCALIVNHGLLSRPELLWGDMALSEFGDDARNTLAVLRASFQQLTQGGGYHLGVTLCDHCLQQRQTVMERALKDSDARFEARLSKARDPWVIRQIQYEMERERAKVRYGAQSAIVADCPHVALRNEALGALCRAYPELALEGVGVLVPAMRHVPARFALNPGMLKSALGPWLMGRRMHAAPPTWSVVSGWGGYGRRRGVPRRRSEDRGARLTAAMTFAASAWGFSLDDALSEGDSGATTTTLAALAGDDASEATVAAVLPPGVELLPLLVEATPKPPRKPRTPRAARETTTVEETTDEGATVKPGGPYMASQLRAMGHDDAAIKRMLKSGELERVAFGWYRLKRG